LCATHRNHNKLYEVFSNNIAVNFIEALVSFEALTNKVNKMPRNETRPSSILVELSVGPIIVIVGHLFFIPSRYKKQGNTIKSSFIFIL
jgi:hypothetical protein